MAVPAISIFGHLLRNQGIAYLKTNCVFQDNSNNALLGHWQAARKRLDLDRGSPVANPGSPEMLDVPAGNEGHLASVEASPRFAMTVAKFPWQFKLVEIDPLLAFQIHIETVRGEDLWTEVGKARDVAALLHLCLPTTMPDIHEGVDFVSTPDPANTSEKGSVTFDSANPNLRVMGAQSLGQDANQKIFYGGIGVGEATRLVHVARFEGRCFLRNGFHRATRLRSEGVTHMPCLVLDVANFANIGIKQDGSTFDRKTVESNNPPVCAHYARGYDVEVRTRRRLIKMSWTEQTRIV